MRWKMERSRDVPMAASVSRCLRRQRSQVQILSGAPVDQWLSARPSADRAAPSYPVTTKFEKKASSDRFMHARPGSEEQQPSKLKVAGSNPAGVASRINHLVAIWVSLVFPGKRLGKSMGRDAASRRIDPVSRWQCAPRATSSSERRHRSLALTRSRVSPHNRASGAVVVLAGGERPQPRLKIPMVPPEVGGRRLS